MLNAIEDEKESAGPPKDSDGVLIDYEIEIEAKADDVLYLCHRMLGGKAKKEVGMYDEYKRIAWHVPEAVDLFINLRAEADKLWAAYETGGNADDTPAKEKPKK